MVFKNCDSDFGCDFLIKKSKTDRLILCLLFLDI